MKKFTQVSIMILLITIWSISIAQVGINSDGTEPDGSAMLDVKSTDKGFLPPRMTEEQRDAINSPMLGLQIFNTNTNRPNYFNGSLWLHFDNTPAEPLSIGDFYHGGIIFYLDGSGGGMVCAISDQSTSTEWGCSGTTISGADGIAIGTGAQNTIDIEADCTTPGIAADICANLSLNSYTDWFLPSKDELNEMYINKAIIDATALVNGGTALVANLYWSSSEFNYGNGWGQLFSNGNTYAVQKQLTYLVRAVRAI